MPEAPRTFPRPIPRVGDTTSSQERANDPSGWAFPPDQIQAFDAVLAARRDVRRYRPDELPAADIHRILSAGHSAPSVGHSQPWRFVTVKRQATRDHAAHLADQARLRQAEKLTPERAQALKDLQLEGIREAPLGVVVLCDRRAKPSGVLGRDTFHDADVWSCACAIENMWLAARAAGIGMGWVTLFNPQDLLDLVGAPAGVTTLGWLCFGYPDERQLNPGLERAGWSKRMPLESVVLAERWQDGEHIKTPASYARSASEPSHREVTPNNIVQARDSSDQLLTPPGSLGILATATDRINATYRTPPTQGHLLVATADHLVADLPVTAFSRQDGKNVIAATTAGSSLGAATAAATKLRFTTHHCGTSDGNIADTDALTPASCDALLHHGITWGAAHGEHQLIALGEVGMGNTTIASGLSAALLGLTPAETVGVGAAGDTSILTHKTTVLTKALGRLPRNPTPRDILHCVGGPEVAYLTGVIQGVARVGGVCVLDGLLTSCAALLATRMAPGVTQHLVAGPVSREQAHRLVLTELGLEPLLDIRLRSGEGVGAALCTQLLLATLSAQQNTSKVR